MCTDEHFFTTHFLRRYVLPLMKALRVEKLRTHKRARDGVVEAKKTPSVGEEINKCLEVSRACYTATIPWAVHTVPLRAMH